MKPGSSRSNHSASLPILGAAQIAKIALLAAIACLAASLPVQAAPYTIPDTEVIDLPTSANGIDYELYIHLPPACRQPGKICPTVYMLDAEYSFGLAAQIVTHLADRNRIPPVVSVAIGYPDKSQYRRFRSRDYTPYFHPTGGYGKEMQKQSGGGPAFLQVIADQIIPYVEQTYPVAKGSRTLVGHSYGGLFTTYAWIERPELFQNYIIVSPSLWYADKRPLHDAAEACAKSPTEGTPNLFLAVGSYEEQPENGFTMVSDLQRLDTILAHCQARKAVTALQVFDKETHASIFPTAFSTGLRKLFQ